jgi:DNA-binding TFAR19-related protein (PDSD5 family)
MQILIQISNKKICIILQRIGELKNKKYKIKFKGLLVLY